MTNYKKLYSMIPKGKFLTVKDVKKRLGIGERSVYRYLKDGRLKATKIGGWRITEKNLADFIKKSINPSK